MLVVDTRLREAERRWRSGGNWEDQCAYLREHERTHGHYPLIVRPWVNSILYPFVGRQTLALIARSMTDAGRALAAYDSPFIIATKAIEDFGVAVRELQEANALNGEGEWTEISDN